MKNLPLRQWILQCYFLIHYLLHALDVDDLCHHVYVDDVADRYRHLHLEFPVGYEKLHWQEQQMALERSALELLQIYSSLSPLLSMLSLQTSLRRRLLFFAARLRVFFGSSAIVIKSFSGALWRICLENLRYALVWVC